jgi:mannose-6-phosphate isomerase-like protein (cupin superfamily)
MRGESEQRPWGGFEVLLDEPTYKVKRITVDPGHRLSLQRHRRRSEHWFVAAGEGVVTVGERQERVRPGVAIDIPTGAKHRMHNDGDQPLIFIEVQRGDYFGEDDIERLDDDYHRALG